MKTNPLKNTVQKSLFTLFISLALLSCEEENPTPPLMGEIWGEVSLSAEESGVPTSEMYRKFRRTAEAILIFEGDTLARQMTESTGFFKGGEFRFPDLSEGKYEVLVRKPGFIPRHIKNVSFTREYPSIRGFVRLFIKPPQIIDTLDFELVPATNPDVYGLAITASFSNRTFYGPDYFVALLSRKKRFRPGKEDFRITLKAHEDSIQDTVFYYNVPQYVSGDTVYVKFIPLSLGTRSSSGNEKLYGQGSSEKDLPYLNMNNVIEGFGIYPRR